MESVHTWCASSLSNVFGSSCVMCTHGGSIEHALSQGVEVLLIPKTREAKVSLRRGFLPCVSCGDGNSRVLERIPASHIFLMMCDWPQSSHECNRPTKTSLALVPTDAVHCLIDFLSKDETEQEIEIAVAKTISPIVATCNGQPWQTL